MEASNEGTDLTIDGEESVESEDPEDNIPTSREDDVVCSELGQMKAAASYSNSEVVESSCLKPSVTKNLFNLRCSKKTVKQKRDIINKKHSLDLTDGQDSLQLNGLVMDLSTFSTDCPQCRTPMSRPVSLPDMPLPKTECHCKACCSCSPNNHRAEYCPVLFSYGPNSDNGDVDASSDCVDITDRSCANEEVFENGSDCRASEFKKYLSTNDNQTQCTKCQHDKPGRPVVNSSVDGLSNQCRNNCSTKMTMMKFDTSKSSVGHGNKPNFCDKVSPDEFRQKKQILKEWFGDFTENQKSLFLKELLQECHQPQIHMLSVELQSRLHYCCPPNCQDPFNFLPEPLSLSILSYLDPVSLCRATCVNHLWKRLSSDQSLWRRLCSYVKWSLSRSSEQKQLLNLMLSDGSVDWRRIFAERFRLRNNWLKGRCNVRTFEGHTQGVSCVQFDDTRIVSGSSDKTIKLWNIRTNSPWEVQTLVGHSGTVRCLHLDGNRLVSGSTDRTIKVWDLSTQQSWAMIACKVTMVGHTDTVRCLKVDDDKVISGSYDKTLKVWNIKTGVCRSTLRGHEAAVLSVQFDEYKIISGSCDKTIKVWTFEGNCVMTLQGHQDAVTCLQFDDTRIISGSLDCTLRFWDIRCGHCLNTIDWKASEGHTRVVRCLQADSWRIVSASDDKTIKVWSLETGQRLVTLRNHTDGVTCLQFNDNVIVSGSYDKTVKLWDFSCC